ncbi:MAG TPA: hypothetical protein PKV98_13265 [Burkholderiaceae bacterium]|nr:hypothetical protein [Burkholderiaceae bacterium]
MECELMVLPVLSTGHVSKATHNRLEQEGDANPWFHVAPYEYGWFLSMPSDIEFLVPTPPPDLLALMRWARVRGYAWIRLDQAGSEVEGVPLHDC